MQLQLAPQVLRYLKECLPLTRSLQRIAAMGMIIAAHAHCSHEEHMHIGNMRFSLSLSSFPVTPASRPMPHAPCPMFQHASIQPASTPAC